MCGIVGIVAAPQKLAAAASSARAAALARIRHRGPDSQGEFTDDRVWLGHARLRILDLSDAGCQPMLAPDGRQVICYNGEVYNFRELADELTLDDLRSHSDTEVVLRAFGRLGPAAFGRLNGIFAFALYDRRAEQVYLVRDRLGVKPLYYKLDGERLAFASELGALVTLLDGEVSCDRAALHEWLYYGATLGPRTLYADVGKLLPGHYIVLDLRTMSARTVQYWSAAAQATAAATPDPRAGTVAETRHLLETAVGRQLVSDVPVGVFLSGGVDSSAITAFATRHSPTRLATYSVGFDFARGPNELPMARRVAALFGTDHHELHVRGADIADVVERLVQHHGLPFSDAANIPLYLLGREVREDVKVVLQGDGGDELFGGYSRYTTLSFPATSRLLAKGLGIVNSAMPHTAAYYRRRRYARALAPRDPAQIMALLLTEEDALDHPEDVFKPAFREEVLRGDPFMRYRECRTLVAHAPLLDQMFLLDAMIILPDIFLEKVDRATMAVGLEVRVPFLDADLVDFCLALPGRDKVRRGRKKWLLKEALRGIVPDEVLFGKKKGFSVPYGEWLRDPLAPLFHDHLACFEARFPEVFSGDSVRAMLAAHQSGERSRAFLLWKLLNLMIWANGQGPRFTL